MRDGAHARSNGGGGPTARSARGQVFAPGIERRTVQIVAGEPTMREGRRVGAADNDCAGFAKVGDDRAVFGGNDIAEGNDAIGGRASTLIDIDLDSHGNAMQRAQLHP